MGDALFAADSKGASERATGFVCAIYGAIAIPRHNLCVSQNLNAPTWETACAISRRSLGSRLVALRLTAGR